MPCLSPFKPAGNFVVIYAARIKRPGEDDATALARARAELPTLARLADDEAGERRRRRRPRADRAPDRLALGP
jgi:hypothetical protein